MSDSGIGENCHIAVAPLGLGLGCCQGAVEVNTETNKDQHDVVTVTVPGPHPE